MILLAFRHGLRVSELISLEWQEIAERHDETLSDRQFANLSSAIRLFVLGFYRDRQDVFEIFAKRLTLSTGFASVGFPSIKAAARILRVAGEAS